MRVSSDQGRGLLNASLVVVPLIGDTIFVLLFFKRSTAPIWFDAIAAAILMIRTVGGAFLRELTSGGVKTRYSEVKVLRSLRGNQARSAIDREESSQPSESCSNCAW